MNDTVQFPYKVMVDASGTSALRPFVPIRFMANDHQIDTTDPLDYESRAVALTAQVTPFEPIWLMFAWTSKFLFSV